MENLANQAAFANLDKTTESLEFATNRNITTDQIALAFLASHVAVQQRTMEQMGAMLHEILDRVEAVDDRVDMVADRTWRSRHLILDAINRASDKHERQRRSTLKNSGAFKRPRQRSA